MSSGVCACDVGCVILGLAVLVDLWLTRRQTHGHSIYHAEHSSRGENISLSPHSVYESRGLSALSDQGWMVAMLGGSKPTYCI